MLRFTCILIFSIVQKLTGVWCLLTFHAINFHAMASQTQIGVLRQQIISNFSFHGLTLKSDAANHLVDVLAPYAEDADINEIIDHIIDAVQKQPLQSSIVTRETVEIAVEECNQASDVDSEKAMVVIDAFDIPKFTYNADRKKFLPIAKESLKLHAGARAKADVFRERYALLHQRTMRHVLFTPPALGHSAQSTSKFQLRSVDFLLSSSGLPDKIIVLGMLSQIKEGKYHLEDTTGCVELNLSNATFHMGLFVENSIVLAEGIYDDKIFHLSAVGFPPPEVASDTQNYFGNTNFFGGPSAICPKASVKLQAMLRENDDAMLVFLSDVYLDDPRVMEKLSTLFAGYSDAPPTAFVFMGNFSAAPYGPQRNQRLKASFKSLADLILQYRSLAEASQFFFVPGPNDLGHANILPNPGIPQVLVSDITSRIPTAQFCSNPVRIQFCTREIVVFRDDIMNKLCRHCVKSLSELTDLPNLFTKTILSQAHLCPLPLHARPIYWSHDHALRLYPLPDLVVIGDKCDPFTISSMECTVTNVGSLAQTEFEFKVYVPASNQIEDSKITD